MSRLFSWALVALFEITAIALWAAAITIAVAVILAGIIAIGG